MTSRSSVFSLRSALLALVIATPTTLSIPCFAASPAPIAPAHSLAERGRTHPGASWLSQIPLAFEANQGQAPASARFLAKGSGYSLLLSPNAAVLSLHRSDPASTARPSGVRPRSTSTATSLRMRLVGSDPKAALHGDQPLPGRSNYFIGPDPRRWRTNIPQYGRVRYHNVYPGIDLIYYGKGRQIEHDFIVSPGASPSSISLRFDLSTPGRTHGPELKLRDDGALAIRTGRAELRLLKPDVYQTIRGQRRSIDGSFVLKSSDRVCFKVAAYDRRAPLVIDPILAYSTYFGGSSDDAGTAIAVDINGNAYIAGYTDSTNLPNLPGVFQPNLDEIPGDATSIPVIPPTPTEDAFVVKLDPTGTQILYSTYLGGDGTDAATGIAVDNTGAAYVIGTTTSTTASVATSFPIVAGAFQSTSSAQVASFVTKLDPTGTALQYSSFLSGSGVDEASSIAIDSTGDAYLVGTTSSADFLPTVPVKPLLTTFNGNLEGFLVEVNPTGESLLLTTYLGGSFEDHATGVALDSTDAIYVTGWTTSPDFPTTVGVVQPHLSITPDGANSGQNAFICKLNLTALETAPTLVYSTFLGGTCLDFSNGIAVDEDGNACITGYTCSEPSAPGGGGFPILNAIHPTLDGQYGTFVTKLNAAASGILFSTYLGTSDFEDGTAVASDTLGNTFVVGQTQSTSLPVTPNAVQLALNTTVNPTTGIASGANAFLTVLDPNGNMIYGTYLGGSGGDAAAGLAIDAADGAYLTGYTRSTNFPLQSPLDSTLNAGFGPVTSTVTTTITTSQNPSDAFIAKISIPPAAPTNLTAMALSSTQVALQWTGTSTTASAFTLLRAVGLAGSFTPIDTVSGSTTTFTDTNLNPNTVYLYEVQAYNQANNVFSADSNVAQTETLPNPLAIPPPPTGVSATTITSQQINVSWVPGSTNEATFKIERMDPGSTTFKQVAEVDAAVSIYSDTTVGPGLAYSYEVLASNAVGDSPPSNSATATTLNAIPGPPTALMATGVTQTQVTLSWTAPADSTILGYRIQRMISNESFVTLSQLIAPGVTSFTDTGLTPNTAYAYQVVAFNNGGTSGPSNSVSITTTSGTISGVVEARFNGVLSALVGVTVELHVGKTAGILNETTTDTGGHYSFTGLADGSYTVTVDAPGQTSLPSNNVTVSAATNNSNATSSFALLPLATFPAGISLISLPYDYTPTLTDAASLLGTSLIATYDPSLQPAAYRLYSSANLPGANGKVIVAGHGYWIKDSATEALFVAGAPVSTPFPQPLSPGWNMIGDPFTNPLDINSLTFTAAIPVNSISAGTPIPYQTAIADQLLGTTIWGYNPLPLNSYSAASTLQPFVGYWIYVESTPLNIIFTNSGA